MREAPGSEQTWAHLFRASQRSGQLNGDSAWVVLRKEAEMADSKFLTPDEVADRYRGGVSVGTLRNWRAMRLGPSFVKIGKAVLYPLDELDAWDEKNKVQCRVPNGPNGHRGDQA